MRDEAKKWFKEAGKLFEESKYNEAAELYTRAISMDPDYASAYFNRALCHAILDNYEQAELDVWRVLELDRGAADARYVYGVVCEYQGRYAEAAHWYLSALVKNPSLTIAKERLTSLVAKLTQKPQPQEESTLTEASEVVREELNRSPPDTSELGETPAVTGEDSAVESSASLDGLTRVGVGKEDDGLLKKAALYRVNTRFVDVVGLTDVKRLIEDEVILPLRHPEVYAKYGRQPGMSLLLYGPPGNGKTLLAKAVAGELGALFIQVNPNEVLNRYIGDSEKNIHQVFEDALSLATGDGGMVVLFIDELDGLGSTRTSVDPADRRVMSQLLVEVERAARTPHIILLGATNRPWDVDPALKRGGRFERLVYVPPPTKEGRLELLRAYLGRAPVAEPLDLAGVAARTEGYSCGDLKWLVERAKSITARREVESGVGGLTQADLEAALAEKPRGSLGEWFLQALLEAGYNPAVAAEYPELYRDVKRFTRRIRFTRSGRGSKRRRGKNDTLGVV